MKTLITLFILLPLFTIGQEPDSAWIVQHYTKQEQYITMRDGVRLFTSIYLPNDSAEKHPILILRTPYSSGPYGEGKFRPFWAYQHRRYFREKYIFVIQDVRGKFMSEGDYMDVRPFNPRKKSKTDIDEGSDTYDSVDWLVKNLRNSNGRVGVFGISYPGFYASQAALSGHPAVVAVSPQAPVTDWFIGDDWHHNGAFMQYDAFNFYIINGFDSPRPGPTTKSYNPGYQPPTKDAYEFFLRTGSVKNLTRLAGDSMSFWKQIMGHPNHDTFWQRRNVRNALHGVKPAMLVVGGLFDAEDVSGAWNTYKAIEKQNPSTINKVVMGPWFHGQWAGNDGTRLGKVQFGENTSNWYMENVELPFFNYYLKGEGDSSKIKEATVFFTGENTWRQLEKWPVSTLKNRSLYLQQNGNLRWEKSSASNSYSQ